VKYAIEMASGGLIHKLGFMKFGIGVQAVLMYV
jgi:hypothetical protein